MPGKTESVSIRRGLSIYKQPMSLGRGSPFWYARVHMRLGTRDTHIKSTRTTDERLALRRAEDFWSETAMERMRDSFERLLHVTGLKIEESGSKRVIGCLRHSSIMFRIFDGVDVHVIARAAGTSVNQIERFYASRYSVGRQLGALQGKR